MTTSDQQFTPALGRPGLTPLYDLAVGLATRERAWRTALVWQIDLKEGESLVDVGCGTGSLAILLKRMAPGARVVGLDPDPEALAIAARKAGSAGLEIEWRRGFARDAGAQHGVFDKAVSSLVFHQVPLAEKAAGIAAMVDAVRPGGSVHIADYARQDGALMRRLFRVIQRLDGKENTQANADGAIERLLDEQRPGAGTARRSVRTMTGRISLFELRKVPVHG